MLTKDMRDVVAMIRRTADQRKASYDAAPAGSGTAACLLAQAVELQCLEMAILAGDHIGASSEVENV